MSVEELRKLKFSALERMAHERGIAASAIDEAINADLPKVALVALLAPAAPVPAPAPALVEEPAVEEQVATAEARVAQRRGAGLRSSQYEGVCWSKRHRRWQAGFMYEGRRGHLGYFVDEALAHAAVRKERRRLRQKARLEEQLPSLQAMRRHYPTRHRRQTEKALGEEAQKETQTEAERPTEVQTPGVGVPGKWGCLLRAAVQQKAALQQAAGDLHPQVVRRLAETVPTWRTAADWGLTGSSSVGPAFAADPVDAAQQRRALEVYCLAIQLTADFVDDADWGALLLLGRGEVDLAAAVVREGSGGSWESAGRRKARRIRESIELVPGLCKHNRTAATTSRCFAGPGLCKHNRTAETTSRCFACGLGFWGRLDWSSRKCKCCGHWLHAGACGGGREKCSVCAAPKQALSGTVRRGDLDVVRRENRAYLGALGRLHHQRLHNSGAGLTPQELALHPLFRK